MSVKVVHGDLFERARQGKYMCISHGCNCFCVQKAGIAKIMAKEYSTDNPNFFKLEDANKNKADINKLGNVELFFTNTLWVANMYTQFRPGPNFDHDAFSLCAKKLDYLFRGYKIGIPAIGCGIGGSDINSMLATLKLAAKFADWEVVIIDESMYQQARES